eukprot:148191-Ditylum_brightwellii.AAC.1
MKEQHIQEGFFLSTHNRKHLAKFSSLQSTKTSTSSVVTKEASSNKQDYSNERCNGFIMALKC